MSQRRQRRTRRKLREDGGYKQTGLRDGDRRGNAYTIFFKHEVVKHLRHLQTQQKKGLCGFPNDDTAEYFKLTKGVVSKWQKKEAEFERALQHVNAVKGKGKRASAADKLIPFLVRDLLGY